MGICVQKLTLRMSIGKRTRCHRSDCGYEYTIGTTRSRTDCEYEYIEGTRCPRTDCEYEYIEGTRCPRTDSEHEYRAKRTFNNNQVIKSNTLLNIALSSGYLYGFPNVAALITRFAYIHNS